MLFRFSVTLVLVASTVFVGAPVAAQAPGVVAPTGTLRACANLTLVFVAGADPERGGVGPVVDLAQELASRAGVGFEVRGYRTDAERQQRVSAGECDVASHSVPATPEAEALLDAAVPLFDVDLTYLVPPGSPIQSAAEADQPGVRLAAARPTTAGRALPGLLVGAEFVGTATTDEAVELVTSGQVDALAGTRPDLELRAERWAGARVVAGRFAVQQFGFAVPRGETARLATVNAFTEHAKDSGLAQAALDRHGVRGVQVASPAAARQVQPAPVQLPRGLPRTGDGTAAEGLP